MGWTNEMTVRPLADFLKSRIEPWEKTKDDGEHIKTSCIAHKYVMANPGAGTLYTVWETISTPKDGPETARRWIGVDQIRFWKGNGWGYKDMCASMGPNEVSCPIKFLEMVPPPTSCPKACKENPYGEDGCKCGGCHGCGNCWENDWRERVYDYAERKKARQDFLKRLKIGDPIVIAKGWTGSGNVYKVSSLKPLIADYSRIPARAIDINASLVELGKTLV